MKKLIELTAAILVFSAIALFSFVSCSDSSAKEFSGRFAAAGKEDKSIDSEELAALLSIVQKSKHHSVKFNNIVVRSEDDIVKAAEALNWSVIVSPTNEPPAFTRINVYMENSASMKGYVGVNGNGDFAAPVVALFHGGNDNTEYSTFYVGEDSSSKQVKFTKVDNEKFLSSLANGTFSISASSPLHQILKEAINRITDNVENQVSQAFCLITDGILSGTNAQIAQNSNYTVNNLALLEDCIRQPLETAKNKFGLHVLVYRLTTRFKGVYYDYKNGRHDLDCTRPYYMIIVGDRNNLDVIEHNLLGEENFRCHEIMRFASFDASSIKTVTNGTLQSVPNGKCKVSPSAKNPNVAYSPKDLDPTNPVRFAVQFNLSDLPSYVADADYITDNLFLTYTNKSSGVAVTIDSGDWLDNVDFDSQTRLCKVRFMLSDSALRKIGRNKVTLSLAGHQDNWYQTLSTSDDSHIENGDENTFALSYLMGGIMKAYGYQATSNVPDAIRFSFALESR